MFGTQEQCADAMRATDTDLCQPCAKERSIRFSQKSLFMHHLSELTCSHPLCPVLCHGICIFIAPSSQFVCMVEKAGDQELGAAPTCLGLATTVAQKQRKRVKVGGGFFVNVLLTHSRRLTAVGFAVQRHFKVRDAITTNYRRSILIGNLSLQRVRIDYEFGPLSLCFFLLYECLSPSQCKKL